MSPRRGQANPIRKIKLKMTLEGGRPSLVRASKALKGSKLTGDALVTLSSTSDPAEAIQEMARIAEAIRSLPKDFK